MISPRINTIGPRRVANTKLVLQAEFAVAKASERENRLLTRGFGECVVVPFMSPETGVAGLAHFDVKTRLPESFNYVILPQFARMGGGALQAEMVGGNGSNESESLVRELSDVLTANGIVIKGMNIGNLERPAGLMVDAATMQVLGVERECLDFDSKESLQRTDVAIRYIMDNPERLIRFVA